MNATGIAAEVAAVLSEPEVARKLALAEALCEAARRVQFDPDFERGARTRPARPATSVAGSRETPRRPDLRPARGRALIHSGRGSRRSGSRSSPSPTFWEPRGIAPDMLHRERGVRAHAS